MSGAPTFPEIDYLCNWSNPKHLKPTLLKKNKKIPQLTLHPMNH